MNETRLYAVAVTVIGPEPDAQVHTYVRVIPALDAVAALEQARLAISHWYANDPDPAQWTYKFAVSAPIAVIS